MSALPMYRPKTKIILSGCQKITCRVKKFCIHKSYFNDLNIEAHYKSTGPEIWQQTAGKITHLVASLEQEVPSLAVLSI